MATRPATAPEAAPRLVGVPSRIFSTSDPAEQRGGGGDLRVHERERGRAVRAERRAGVEPEPAEPQQAGAEQDERQVVRPHRRPSASRCRLPSTSARARPAAPALMWTAVPPAKSSTPALASQPAPCRVRAAEVEHPVRDREVDERRPRARRRSLQARNFARSAMAPEMSAGRDDREHQLERRRTRSPGSPSTPPFVGQLVHGSPSRGGDSPTAEKPFARVAERHGEPVEHPQDADDADRDERHHHHVERRSSRGSCRRRRTPGPGS